MALDDLGYNRKPHAQAMISHSDRDRFVGGGEIHLDIRPMRRLFDGIAQQVGKDRPRPGNMPRCQAWQFDKKDVSYQNMDQRNRTHSSGGKE